MNEHKRINWKDGLDITSETLIEADNYHIAQRSIAARLNTFRLYGILPDTTFEKNCRIDSNILFISELYCSAITKGGYIIDTDSNLLFDEVNLKELEIGTYYVVLQINPFQPNNQYRIEIQKFTQYEETGIPILKIYCNVKNKGWQIDHNYIPPSISLSTNAGLIDFYDNIKDEFAVTMKKLPIKDALFQMKLLEVELVNYSMQESPAELVLLLKKIVALFQLLLAKTKKTNKTLSTLIEEFMQISYVHSDIFPILQSGIDCLKEINRELDKPELVEEILDIV
jgi:hypothetical protein